VAASSAASSSPRHTKWATRLGSRPRPAQPGGTDRRSPPVAAYDDYAALDELAQGCAAISTEFENVPAGTLDYLDKFVVVRPSAAAVSVCQNRIAEKDFLRDNGLPHARFVTVHNEQELRQAGDELFPGNPQGRPLRL
jgi:5-(carboxyamino)imidazole ribonucleotide synthase